MKDEIKIYTINCPITNTVKYIGKTKQKIEKRLQQHINNIKRSNTKLSTWIKSLKKQNLLPIIEEIDITYDNNHANILEIMYIGLFRSWNIDLKNHTDGGDGMCNMSKEIREKISKTRTGKYTGENNGFYGKSHTKETLEILRKPKSQESKIKNSNTIKKLHKTGVLNSKGKNNAMSKKIAKYDLENNLIKIYDYITEAELDGYNRRYTGMCANNKIKTYKGFIWKFINN